MDGLFVDVGGFCFHDYWFGDGDDSRSGSGLYYLGFEDSIDALGFVLV